MNGFPDIPTDATVRQLIAQGEGPTLELKQSVPSVLGLGQLIASFANAQGGVIIVGVRAMELLDLSIKEPTSQKR